MIDPEALARLRAKIAAKKADRERATPMRPPRYDEVFFAGTAWMDAMEGAGPVEPKCLIRFREALDERLLNLCTDVDGALLLTIPEYERWQREGHLAHVRDARPVQDAFAAAYQDTVVPRNEETYEYVKALFGMFAADDSENPWGTRV